VPVEIGADGKPNSRAEEDDDAVEYKVIATEEDITPAVRIRASNITDIRVTNKGTMTHGATPGCPACRHILDNKKITRGV
jgi:hypothetical protein